MCISQGGRIAHLPRFRQYLYSSLKWAGTYWGLRFICLGSPATRGFGKIFRPVFMVVFCLTWFDVYSHGSLCRSLSAFTKASCACGTQTTKLSVLPAFLDKNECYKPQCAPSFYSLLCSSKIHPALTR